MSPTEIFRLQLTQPWWPHRGGFRELVFQVILNTKNLMVNINPQILQNRKVEKDKNNFWHPIMSYWEKHIRAAISVENGWEIRLSKSCLWIPQHTFCIDRFVEPQIGLGRAVWTPWEYRKRASSHSLLIHPNSRLNQKFRSSFLACSWESGRGTGRFPLLFNPCRFFSWLAWQRGLTKRRVILVHRRLTNEL